MRKLFLFFFTIFIISLAGCTSTVPLAPRVIISTPVQLIPSNTPEGTPQCAWNQGYQSLPDVSQQVQIRLEQDNLPINNVYAEAFGETCLGNSGLVLQFAARKTDYSFQFLVDDTSNQAALADIIIHTLVVLDQFPVSKTPGSQPGNISIQFKSPSNNITIHFARTAGDAARKEGLTGSALLQALQRK